MRFSHRILPLLLGAALSLSVSAQNLNTISDSARISLLTCGPGQAVWAQYGHTAIRISDPEAESDITFNYGIFDFNSKNFIVRFIQGKTDYILGCQRTSSFFEEYRRHGRYVTEQVLDLSPEECRSLWNALCVNSLPENRTYRYNFIYDNCATRARVIIEKNLRDGIGYTRECERFVSLRDALLHYTQDYPWTGFGISLLISSEADRQATFRELLFAPEVMHDAFSSAVIPATDSIPERPLVSQENRIVEAGTPDVFHCTWLEPVFVCWLIFLLSALSGIFEWKNIHRQKKGRRWWIDGLLFGTAGLAGCIIAFLSFFSVHPIVHHNWLLLWLQPLQLLFALALLFPSFRRGKAPHIYLSAVLPFLLFAIAGRGFLPQYFHPATLPLQLALTLRCLLSLFSRWTSTSKPVSESRPTQAQARKQARHRNSTPLILLTVTVCLPWNAQAQKDPQYQGPRLVIGIHIDQLQEDYLRWFMDGLGQDGLKKLIENGRFYHNVSYGSANKDGATVIAGAVTGCPPMYHGIIADEWFDTQEEQRRSCVFDKKSAGLNTVETYSPKNLLVSNLADELKKAAGNNSKVFSVGIQPEPVIVSAGKMADGAYWMDNRSAKWCSSTYYNYMPRWLHQHNEREGNIRLESNWTPKYSLKRYIRLPHQNHSLFFDYAISKTGWDNVRFFKETPMANSRVLSLATTLIHSEQLGQDAFPDLLNVHLNAGSRLCTNDIQSSLEMQDFYFRLDEDLSAFLKDIDQYIGLDHVLIYLLSSGEATYPVSETESTPSFYPERCQALLNLYLGALYGNDRWIIGQNENELYLNHKLIDSKKLSMEEVCRASAYLLSEMDGIQQVFSGQNFIVNGAANEGDVLFRNNYCKGRSGDLCIRIENGRNIRWESYPSFDRQLRYASQRTFLIFYGSGITSERISDQISVFDIAPTLSRLLYIRPPTASTGEILFEQTEN